MPTIISDKICDLYSLLDKGLKDERQGKLRPLSEALTEIREEIEKQTVLFPTDG